MNPWRITTWNVQGSHGVDREFVGAHIAEMRPDVFVVQEILHRQAVALASDLSMHLAWARKHTPVPTRSEGMAILTPHRLAEHRSAVVTKAMPWSWRRRVIVSARIERGDESLRVVNAHLSPHALADRRTAEIKTIVDRFPFDVLAGDFNDSVPATAAKVSAIGAVVDASPTGPPTCWPPGPRVGRLPTTRMDGILSVPTFAPLSSFTPTDDLDRWAGVSDHLPVTVDLERRAP